MSARYRFREAVTGTRPAPEPMRVRKRSFLATLAFVWIATTLCILPRPVIIPANLYPGLIWSGDQITAPDRLVVRDYDAENQVRRETQLRHARVFKVQAEPTERTRSRVLSFIQTLEKLPTVSTTRQQDENADALFKSSGARLSPTTMQALAGETTESLQRLLMQAVHALMLDRGVTADRVLLDTARQSGNLVLFDPLDRITSTTARHVVGWPTEALHVLENRILPELGAPPALVPAIVDILADLVDPNVSYDSARSGEELTRALQGITVQREIPEGTLLVRTGERLRETQVAALLEARILYYQRNLENAAGAALVAMLAIILLILYSRRYQGSLLPDPRTVLMLAMPVILAVSLGRVTQNILGPDIGPAALPAGMVGMVAAILFDARFALLLSIMTPLLFAVGSPDPALATMLTGILTGAVGAFSLNHLRERWHVLLAGFYVGLACLISTIAMALLHPSNQPLQSLILPAAINGLTCYGMTVMVLPFFELVFKATTAWRLLELTSGDHPLLNQLEREAPGTHEHSLNVAKLAEAACDEIGANALLARAGAYFHDIGKMLKPRYFIENQETPEDKKVHSRLTPSMSALIIRDHVRYGIELAEQHKIPDRVVDFIAQHHGTSSIAYFLNQERKRLGPEDKLAEDVFRYPGPRPQSIEAGIVMIADSLDATSVALFSGRNVDEDDVTKLVRDTIARLFADEQFDECPITLEQLSRLQSAFVRALKSRFHARIQYPGKPAPAPPSTSKRPVEAEGPLAAVDSSDETLDISAPPQPRAVAAANTETKTSMRTQ